jgi:hypothetical protein
MGRGGDILMSKPIGPSERLSLERAIRLFKNQAISLATALMIYVRWRDYALFLGGEAWTFPKNEEGKRVVERKRMAWRLPKRGDWLYKDNLRKKLKWIDRLPYREEFNPKDRNKTHKTRFLFITWTTQAFKKFYLHKEQMTIWKEDSHVTNRTLTRLRQHYGRVEYWRSNEGTHTGFPAPHGVLFFPDYEWKVKRMFDHRRTKKWYWRVIGPQYQKLTSILEGKDSRAKPVLGFTDVQGLYHPRASLKHISKYCFMLEGEYPDHERVRKLEIQELTYFWLWITRKHTYSQSRNFPDVVSEYLGGEAPDLTLERLGISKVSWVGLRIFSLERAKEYVVAKYDRGVRDPGG